MNDLINVRTEVSHLTLVFPSAVKSSATRNFVNLNSNKYRMFLF